MDDWVPELRRGVVDEAWNRFIDRYRRLIISAIRHYVQDYDDVMDVFAWVCEALRKDDLRRLRAWVDQPEHRAKFSTWLVTVVRHLSVDWFRHRDGRSRLSNLTKDLSPLRESIVELVFLNGRPHVEAYELICARHPPGPTFREFLFELRATYETVTQGQRGRLLRELSPPPPPPPTAEPAPEIEGMDQRQWLDRVLATLEPLDRAALELYVVEEMPAADIARVLGLPNAKAVYNRVYRSLDALRRRLDQAGIGRSDL
jgi:RNA polymerase sigma factor (sigma-70 family)